MPKPRLEPNTTPLHFSLLQALVGDQYGPCPVPTRIEEKEWEALKAQLTARPRDLELVARSFWRDENAVPPAYLLQALGTEVPATGAMKTQATLEYPTAMGLHLWAGLLHQYHNPCLETERREEAKDRSLGQWRGTY